MADPARSQPDRDERHERAVNALAELLLLIRRSRALRRRSKHTKAVRRARARAYYRAAGEVSR